MPSIDAILKGVNMSFTRFRRVWFVLLQLIYVVTWIIEMVFCWIYCFRIPANLILITTCLKQYACL